MKQHLCQFFFSARMAIASLLLLIFVNGYTQNARVSIEDFKPLSGNWNGKLSYLDYVSDLPETIKAGVDIKIINEKMFEFSIYYTKEPNHNATEKYTIAEKGKMVNERQVIERVVQADGKLKIVMEDRGLDGNDDKMATFHHILLISKDSFVITKMVKYDGKKISFNEMNTFFTDKCYLV